MGTSELGFSLDPNVDGISVNPVLLGKIIKDGISVAFGRHNHAFFGAAYAEVF